ncbi:alpha/beta hydrolase family protein [Propionibacterium australiense]|uniref:Alpha/Beta hydrolase fold n=1 Tax=Propionibacterium australiense TaxID=119981 RepID=A0A383S8V0_9ACTN|nr:alpha/beta fold hydrolase [Propionibacterium australiense]RLP06598.1 alpha/beta fold hydrolase [Propionibacterium australiense]RLP10764.1 alpha/beta fold hydrolase [Propionibacterium australiense]SYZ34420.1 Alpha/Beta hydrolase fold [Propionibacterium australiense]VEH89854.1 acetoin dehydrogenase E2 subunit dihydrolipoyllysine-residue acetyltransferase [Propionibacterium australiense]
MSADQSVRALSFERDGLRIRGELHLPAGDGPFPAAICSHGFGATSARCEPYARFLTAHGVACYLFDFCGGSRHSRSDGSLRDQSVLTEVADLEAVLGGIRTQPLVRPDEVFLVGASQGGYVSGIVAARHPHAVRGLVMLYPALVIPDDAHERYASLDEVPEDPVLFGVPVGRRYYVDAWGLDPARDLVGYAGGVLIVHGEQDEFVPIRYSERAVGHYPHARLVPIPGAGHGFHGEALRTAEQEILELIATALGRA